MCKHGQNKTINTSNYDQLAFIQVISTTERIIHLYLVSYEILEVILALYREEAFILLL